MLLSSIVAVNCYAKDPQMSETKTYCIGRYLVDLPADAKINGKTIAICSAASNPNLLNSTRNYSMR